MLRDDDVWPGSAEELKIPLRFVKSKCSESSLFFNTKATLAKTNMTRFAGATLACKTLLVAGHAMASANLFDGGDDVSSLSDSLISKLTRIVGGVEVSIVSFFND